MSSAANSSGRKKDRNIVLKHLKYSYRQVLSHSNINVLVDSLFILNEKNIIQI